MSFLLECFYLFVKDICLLQFGGPPDSKLDLVCSNCLVLFCRIPLELQHHTTSSHCSVRNTIFILFTRSDFFIPFVYYGCDFHMRKPIVEKFCNVWGNVQNFETLCLFCACSVFIKGAKLPDLQFCLFVGCRQGGQKKCLLALLLGCRPQQPDFNASGRFYDLNTHILVDS